MSDEIDLSLVTTDQLVDELFKRHDHVLIARESFSPKNDYADAEIDFKGGVSAALGLASRCKLKLLGYIKSGPHNEQE